MAKWKLSRQTLRNDVFELFDGDKITIGRGLDNTIILSSIVVSRNHCLIHVKKDEVSITDLKSSNGVYVGLKRIPPNVPYMLAEADVIGFGWTNGSSITKLEDDEKFVFKLEKCVTSITQRIKFQDNALDELEAKLASLDEINSSPKTNVLSPVFEAKLPLKRKLNLTFESEEIVDEVIEIHDDVINLESDSENEMNKRQEHPTKKIKLNTDSEDEISINLESDNENEMNNRQECSTKKIVLETGSEDEIKEAIKCDNEDFQYEAFKVKQEYLGYNDEPIEINSDSDSESEHWIRRLSQGSPGKPLKNDLRERKTVTQPEDGSYSQIDDVFEIKDDEFDIRDEEEFLDDIIYIPLEPPVNYNEESSNLLPKETSSLVIQANTELCNIPPNSNIVKEMKNAAIQDVVEIEDITENSSTKGVNLSSKALDGSYQKHNSKLAKCTQMIEPLNKITKRKSLFGSTKKDLAKSKFKSTKAKKDFTRKISNSQKEERKKKLKQIACRDKDLDDDTKDLEKTANKPVVHVKVTSSNRGAFLTDVIQATVKLTKRKNSPLKRKNSPLKGNIVGLPKYESNTSIKCNPSSECDKIMSEVLINPKGISEQNEAGIKSHSTPHTFKSVVDTDTKLPFKSLKPLTERKESCLGKPVSKVEPLPPKKTVRFSTAPPEILEFEIEPGNRMKKTGLVKTSLVYIQKRQIFSLEKISLITILRWNPHWLTEQMNIAEPPPILSHKKPPVTLFHAFNSHKNYVRVIGDLLLMEVWECITQAFNRKCNHFNKLEFRIESCPLEPPTQDQHIHLSNMNVNLSLPTSEIIRLPRIGEILILEFGPERFSRFVYVHNVRHLSSPPNNRNSFYSISLNATFTEKMQFLKPGELIIGRSLTNINNELNLFEAIEYLAGSPLSGAILRPEPHHFPRTEVNHNINLNSQWTMALNPSQKLAVSNSVSAALGERPGIQMVQGPPGSGKSAVICAIVMTFLYDALEKKQKNRGKILICATSNAAVDELVIRLLKIRQSLPKSERFGMVRVGRVEAMHKRAAILSSQHLAQRDVTRTQSNYASGAVEEISHLEAKINMWKTAQRDAKNPERAAYCRTRVNGIINRLNLLRSSNGSSSGPLTGDRLVQAEIRSIEGADIILTTLSSSHNFKMRGLKGRIALCIVDEAGQAIEPETLLPLTLNVAKLTLIGDPQQLPGFILSPRAKKYGLGESLFSRLACCTEQWDEPPVVLLDRQYRMHAAIAEYPNRAFYDGRVITAPRADVGLDAPPYLVLGLPSGDARQCPSGANQMEAWFVARLATALAKIARAHSLSLAVITPYCAQRDLLRDILRSLKEPSERQVEVNTVDSFQGQERDVVLISLARSNGVGFLTDTGRMNVMLTRARHHLFICLNPMAFVKNNQWQTLIDDARKRKVFRTLPNKLCQPLSPGETSDSILNYVL